MDYLLVYSDGKKSKEKKFNLETEAYDFCLNSNTISWGYIIDINTGELVRKYDKIQLIDLSNCTYSYKIDNNAVYPFKLYDFYIKGNRPFDIQFLNIRGRLYVKGDWGEYIFSREFDPSNPKDTYLHINYWENKIICRSSNNKYWLSMVINSFNYLNGLLHDNVDRFKYLHI